MSVVDLHPEELFDAVRAGALTAADRARLEAHCAECAACRFELQWLETNGSSAEPTTEDRAYGEAAFDRMLRASKHVRETRTPKHWPLRWGFGGVLLGTTLSLALFSGRELWGKSAKPHEEQVSAPHAARDVPREAPPRLDPGTRIVEPVVARAEPQPSAASAPTANALLAAARKARTQGHSSRSRHLYRQVVHNYSSTPAAGAARVALGRLIYDERGDSNSALTLFEAYLRQQPSGALAEEALYYRALSLDRLGRTRQVQRDLRALLTSFPNSLYAAPARARLSDEPGE
jgi:hypothetical protein